MTRFLFLLLLPAFLVLSGSGRVRGSHPALSSLPSQMIWAWERAEELRWLPQDVGVAYVAVAIELSGSKIRVRRRSQALLVAPQTPLVPVVHVDALWHPSPTLNAKQRDAIVAHVLRVASAGNRGVVQLDFEVRRSQRAFLEDIVRRIRQRLPREIALSVTALASWCAGDYWLAEMDADEIVPMAFRMAGDDAEIRSLLGVHRRFVRERCSAAIATATDEEPVSVRALRHYHFSSRSWTPEAWARIRKQELP